MIALFTHAATQMSVKNIISLLALLASILSMPVFAGKIIWQPMYSDARFPPVDAFHASCMQSAQILFEGKETNISKIHLELQYVPEELEIARILGLEQAIANYRIEYNRVIFDIDNPKISGASPLFQLHFQSKSNIASTNLLVATGSYFVSNGKIIYLQTSFSLPFAPVPECTPDSIAPSIQLIFPQTTSDKVPLDQYFIFSLKDSGKGVDKQSVKVMLNDELYTVGTENLVRKGEYLTLYPKDWLPINKKITIQVAASDTQSYGGPNTAEKTFAFTSATGLALLDGISPMKLRTMAKDAAALKATAQECVALHNIYSTSDESFQSILTPLLSKMSCEEILDDEEIIVNSLQTQQKNTHRLSISLFAALGRILFAITFILKFHYIAAYKKHKRLVNRHKSSV